MLTARGWRLGLYLGWTICLPALFSTPALLQAENGPGLYERDWSARLQRGRLHLAESNAIDAEEDFTRALDSDSPRLKARAHVGLGHLLVRNPETIKEALKHYREAIKIDPTCFEALYDPAYVGYLWNELAGKRIASETLIRLICHDPLYPNAYRTWRDLVLDKSDKEIRQVDKCLEFFLKTHPDSASWWVDLACDRFYLSRTSLAFQTLDEMARANPDYVSTAIPLLRARCSLEAGDTDAFYEYYQKAIRIAKSTGDFTPLFRQAEPLFYPAAYQAWGKCFTSDSRVDFFLRFWGTLKPDPLALVNPRLATHYRRLHLAEKQLKLQLPNVPYQPSLAMSFPEEVQHLFRFRHGNKTFNRFWVIGFSGSIADSNNTATVTMSNIMEAIQKQYDIDAGILHSGILTSARFRSASQGKIEVELYQGGIFRSGQKPKAEMAVLDPSWKEIERTKSTAYPGNEVYNFKKTWLSVHRMEIQPGTYWFGVRTQTPDSANWVERGMLVLRGFDEKELDLSGVVLGSLPPDDNETYIRGDIAMAPRPSLRFTRGEALSILFEIYNLGLNQEGARVFIEEIDISLVEDDISKGRELAGGYVFSKNLDPDKSATSLNHRFVRTPKTDSGPVTEFFTIDTSQLRPGNYRMVINIKDNSNSCSKQASCIFELAK